MTALATPEQSMWRRALRIATELVDAKADAIALADSRRRRPTKRASQDVAMLKALADMLFRLRDGTPEEAEALVQVEARKGCRCAECEGMRRAG